MRRKGRALYHFEKNGLPRESGKLLPKERVMFMLPRLRGNSGNHCLFLMYQKLFRVILHEIFYD